MFYAGLLASAALLVASVFLLYWQTGSFDFLRFDDPDYTFRCAFVKDGLSTANLREAFTNVRHGGIWMPATYVSYMAGISGFGPGMGAHHLVNVAIHALNTVLLLLLVVQLATHRPWQTDAGRKPFGPLKFCLLSLVVAFWALHPQRAEAVAWIAGRKELLCATFTLGGILFWLRARKRDGFRACLSLAGVYACFALACMSKPTAMCFPFLVLSLEGMLYVPAQDGETSLPRDVGARRNPILEAAVRICRSRFFVLNFVFFILVSAATGALAVYSQTHPEGLAARELFSASLPWRILNAAVSVGLYLFQMFVPAGIHLDYRSVPGGWPVNGVLGLAVLALAASGLVLAWRWLRRRYGRGAGQTVVSDGGMLSAVLFAIAVLLWFFASLAPTLGIFGSFGEHARADRFLYLPAMAFPIAGCLLVHVGSKVEKTVLAVLALSATALFAISRPVVASYRNDVAAFARTLEADPDNWRALAHVGEWRCAEGRVDEGIDLLRHSQAVMARDSTAAKLAYALMRRGRADDWKAIREVCAGIAADPSRDARGQALEALGTAELVGREWSDAVRHLVLSVRAPGRHYSAADAILKLAFAQHNGGARAEARKLFEWVRDSSGREDLARRASQVLSTLEVAPQGLLFW